MIENMYRFHNGKVNVYGSFNQSSMTLKCVVDEWGPLTRPKTYKVINDMGMLFVMFNRKYRQVSISRTA